jgi:S1-C subfamily serine protease
LDSDQQGVLVQGVGENTPAEESGLLQGDVIIAIDGSQIATIESLIAVLAQYQPGDEITLTLLRNGQELEINLVLGARPS